MSNNSGEAMKALPCFDRVFTKPAEVVALTRVSLEMQSVSIAGDFPVPG